MNLRVQSTGLPGWSLSRENVSSAGGGAPTSETTCAKTVSSLWRHQEEAVCFALDRPATLLNLGLGAGKTRVALTLLERWGARNVLILAPKAVVTTRTWQREADRMDSSIRPIAPSGDTKKKLSIARSASSPMCWVFNYEAIWRKGLKEWALGQDWDAVVLDESTKIKSAGGVTSRFVAQLTKKAKRRLALTGTPLAHSPLDAYGQFRFLDPEIYGTSVTRFRNRYAEVVQRKTRDGRSYPEIVDWVNMDEFARKFHSITFTVRSEDVLDLPPLTVDRITFELEPKTMKVYREMKKHLAVMINDEPVLAANGGVTLLRLQQITGGYARGIDGNYIDTGDRSKLEALRDLLQAMGDVPVVVWTRFTRDVECIRDLVEGLGRTAYELSGRINSVDLWKLSTAGVLIANIQAGARGVDFTHGRYAIYYSIGFSLDDYEQSLKRLHRPGQEHPVTTYQLAAKGTVDEYVYRAIDERRDLVKAALEGVRNES